MNISEMDSQKTYETLPERLATGKQPLKLIPSMESHSYISKIISVDDCENYLFSYDSEEDENPLDFCEESQV